jgi:hypothetical protein
MGAVLIMLTPGGQNELINCQQLKVKNAVLPMMDVKTWWNTTMELVE